MTLMDDLTARRTVKNYVCAHCFGGLQEKFLPERMSEVICPTCGGEPGFVRKEYAEAKKSESSAEKAEVVDLLQQMGIIKPKPKRSIEQNLKELGF